MSSNAETIAAPEVAAEEVGVESEIVKENASVPIVEKVAPTNGLFFMFKRIFFIF